MRWIRTRDRFKDKNNKCILLSVDYSQLFHYFFSYILLVSWACALVLIPVWTRWYSNVDGQKCADTLIHERRNWNKNRPHSDFASNKFAIFKSIKRNTQLESNKPNCWQSRRFWWFLEFSFQSKRESAPFVVTLIERQTESTYYSVFLFPFTVL